MIAEREEDRTHHFRGKWFGFGPVQDDEFLVFAVFETTMRSGRRLSARSFDRKKLINAELSIARQALVTKTKFDVAVARRGEAMKGKFVGLATANAGTIRGIFSEDWPKAAPRKIFGFGILDLVEPGDFDGHGTLGFLVEATVPKTRELGALREFLMFDLADKFSDIRPIEECEWGSPASIGIARFATVWRALKQV
jgi:hypothetical protein